jgi:hypothetical protein
MAAAAPTATPVPAAAAGAATAGAAGLADVSREDPTTLFELLEKRGRGSYGTVYKVRCLLCLHVAGAR